MNISTPDCEVTLFHHWEVVIADCACGARLTSQGSLKLEDLNAWSGDHSKVPEGADTE
jgi:hypothetical protein